MFEQYQINENLRSKLKKYIKQNQEELDTLADEGDWDRLYQKLINDFGVESDSEEAEDLKQTFKFIY